MERLKILINKLKNSPDKMRFAVVLGAVGILLIMLSEILPDSKPDKQNDNTETTETDEADDFRKQTEQQLKELLEQIDGVGECEIMVSVEGTTEYVYAEKISRYTDEDTDRKSDKLD